MVYLIAEDNEDLRSMIREIVSTESDTVIECSDGDEAMRMYQEYRPDYVLMDIEMEPVDGLTALAGIVGKDPSARVIMVTNHAKTAYREAARKGGAVGFVLKDNLMELSSLIGGKEAGR